jgi:tetratricopeptide (TPR) repeat protein
MHRASVAGCSSWRAATLGALLAAASLAAAAPAPEPIDIGEVPPALHEALLRVANEPAANFVLNHLRASVIALELGLNDRAAQSLDIALNGITAIYADSAQAAKARSMWHEEGSKDFKGEPYERWMAFYYRGVVDMMDGDWDNARADFKAGLLQDAFAEEEQNRADVAVLLFLQGWCSQMVGDMVTAREAYEEAKRLRPDLVIPDPKANVLVLAETGYGPRKLGDGVGNYELVYRRGKRFSETRAYMQRSGQWLPLYPIEDVFWQATTRGGRPVDRIIQGKVAFKQNTEAVGSVLTGLASEAMVLQPLTNSRSLDDKAAVVGLIGVAALALSSKAKPAADVRYWESLPDAIHIATLTTDAAQLGAVPFTFIDANNAEVPGLAQSRKVVTDQRGRGLLWVRSRYAINGVPK